MFVQELTRTKSVSRETQHLPPVPGRRMPKKRTNIETNKNKNGMCMCKIIANEKMHGNIRKRAQKCTFMAATEPGGAELKAAAAL